MLYKNIPGHACIGAQFEVYHLSAVIQDRPPLAHRGGDGSAVTGSVGEKKMWS